MMIIMIATVALSGDLFMFAHEPDIGTDEIGAKEGRLKCMEGRFVCKGKPKL